MALISGALKDILIDAGASHTTARLSAEGPERSGSFIPRQPLHHTLRREAASSPG
jgi:hypothetical protein